MSQSVGLSERAGVVPELDAARHLIADLDQDHVPDAVRIDRIRVLEELEAVVAAARARETAAFVSSQRERQAAAGVSKERVGRGIAAQVGLARRISPHAAGRYVGWAMVLTSELPATFAALAAGRVSQRRALLVARETMWLSRTQRAAVDADLAPRLESLSDRGVENQTKTLAHRLDQAAYVDHLSRVEADRHVTIRPAPDAMVRLSALMSVKAGVATYTALAQAAETARAAGDARTRGQVMADTLQARVTGLTTADEIPIALDLIITDQALFTLDNHTTTTGNPGNTGDPCDAGDAGGRGDVADASQEPAVLVAPGVPPVVIPAELARRAVTDASGEASVFIRRLYTHPATGQLVAMDARTRCFEGNLRRFLILRDQTCRTPWCEAPIRHIDHTTPAADGGHTTAAQGQGLCESCNYAKQAPGWTHHVADPDADHPPGTIITTTPTGHTYTSNPPPPPGSPPPGSPPPGRPPTTGPADAPGEGTGTEPDMTSADPPPHDAAS